MINHDFSIKNKHENLLNEFFVFRRHFNSVNKRFLHTGFASYMEYAGVDNIKPDWKIMRDFIVKDVLRAMGTDSSRYTHPLSQPVTNSHQIEEMFDDISYEKGWFC